MNDKTGGAVFPNQYTLPDNQGMTLRDYFAAAAMQGLIFRGFTELGNSARGYANLSYEYADAMIEARNK